MKKVMLTAAALSLLALGAWMLAAAAPTGLATTTADLAEPVPVDDGLQLETPGLAGAGCEDADTLALPEGVEAEQQQACCIDECRVDSDCFFRCGGEPGQCVMANPCCTECQCLASSLALTS